MGEIDPFANIPAGKEGDFRFLLERVFHALSLQLANHAIVVKGKIGEHGGKIGKAEERLESLEKCPCAVHRDPAHTCAILEVRDKLSGIETKLDQKINPLKIRLAWIMGGLAAALFLLDIALRLAGLIWR